MPSLPYRKNETGKHDTCLEVIFSSRNLFFEQITSVILCLVFLIFPEGQSLADANSLPLLSVDLNLHARPPTGVAKDSRRLRIFKST